MHSLIRIFNWRNVDNQGATFLHVDNENSDQTARMRRLIYLFVERMCQ